MLVHDLLREIDNGLPSDTVLNSVYEVDDILNVLAEMDKKVQHLKGLRDYKVQAINAEIAKYVERDAQLRDLILRSLKALEPSQKTFHFPGVGKVTRKQSSGTWEIEDENALLADLEKRGLKDRVVETKEVIDRREMRKVATELIGQNEKLAGLSFKEGDETISITFEGRTPSAKKVDSVPTDQVSHKSIDKLDALEV